MKYTAEILPPARKAIKEIDRRYTDKILDRLTLLETDPSQHGSLKLAGEVNLYRTRVGRYRILYKIFGAKIHVIVVSIDHRKDVCRCYGQCLIVSIQTSIFAIRHELTWQRYGVPINFIPLPVGSG